MLKPLVVITGPTASGKSALALQIAKKYNGELICADSRTVYKGLDIGTAKPTAAEQKEIPHHLLDVVNPDEQFTAAEFKKLAQSAIDDILARGRLPILVGGTGLYVDAIIFNYQFGEPADPKLRQQLQMMSLEDLQLMAQDSQILLPTNPTNKRHLVRAIELGGVVRQQKRLRPDTLVVGLTTDRDNLRLRIEKRAQQMVKAGVLQEVKDASNTYGWAKEALTGNIYRTLRPVVAGDTSLQTGLEQFVMSDMQLAKRQMTWLKRNPYIIWGQPSDLKIAIEHFVQQNKLNESIPSAI